MTIYIKLERPSTGSNLWIAKRPRTSDEQWLARLRRDIKSKYPTWTFVTAQGEKPINV